MTDASTLLIDLAQKAMQEHNLVTGFSKEVQQAANSAQPSLSVSPLTKDLRQKLWFSLDNDDSRDLDQLTYAEALEQNRYKIFIAVADVDHLVKKDGTIDLHAQCNTVSVYTPAKVFPMLPERLSTNLTSLNEEEDRQAIVIEVDVNADGSLGNYVLYPALVHNQAKLAYNSVADWLNQEGPIPPKIAKVPGLELQVKLQDHIAHLLKTYRHDQGALTLETTEIYPLIENHQLIDLKPAKKNCARDLIEDFMIAANTSTARYLKSHQIPSFRRIVRTPKRWDRIVEVAAQLGYALPNEPDSKALDQFLVKQQAQDPLHFPDLSLTIIKLMGNGEYAVEYPGESPIGHFGLSLKDYTHSTAPNRRYPDLITQRLVKASFQHEPQPYLSHELEKLAKICTKKEDEAEKVERKMKKTAAILLLSSKINETFDALVTGASVKGTWVRIFHPPIEGKLIQGFEHVDVGDPLKVKLVQVDIEKGFIDFIKV